MATKKTVKQEAAINSVQYLQEQLNGKFPVSDVKQREGGGGKMLDYLGIEKVINRINEIFPLGYSWEIKEVKELGKNIVITGSLTVYIYDNCRITRDGIGSDKIDADMDKTCKTAFAEAFKKACHTLGIGLYLWDEDARLEIQKERHANLTPTFSPEQIEFMKTIRTKLDLNTDTKLNDLVKSSPFPELKKRTDLNANNIEKFIKWVKADKASELSTVAGA